MILGVIIVAVILLLVLLRSNRDIAIGPVYLLVPIVSFTTGYYIGPGGARLDPKHRPSPLPTSRLF